MEKRYTGFVEKECKWCGKLFTTRLAEIKRGYGKFCSRSCGATYRNLARRGVGSCKENHVMLLCDYCNVEFKRAIGDHNKAQRNGQKNNYCSKMCSINGTGLKKREKYQRLAETKDCPYCGEEFSTYGKQKGQIFCSVACARANRRGESYNGKCGWLAKRFKVLHRDGFRCMYCGKSPEDGDEVRLEVDHIIPRAIGGGDEINNLLTACRECNNGKRDKEYEISKGQTDVACVGNPH